MDYSTPGLPVHCQLLEFTQTLVCWVGDAIQPSHPVVPFSSCLQSFTASGSFQMSQFFATGGQSIGVLASASTLPMNIQDLKIDWFYLLAVQGTLKSLLQHHPNGRKQRGTKGPLDESERGEWKSWLKTQHSKKLRLWHLVPSFHGKQKEKKWKQWQILFSWAPKSLWMLTTAVKLKYACSLEEKLWQT